MAQYSHHDHDHAALRKENHVFLWIFLAIQVIFLIWIITGVSAGTSTACHDLSSARCTSVHGVGTTIGVGLIIGLWVAVDIIAGGGYAVYRLARRLR